MQQHHVGQRILVAVVTLLLATMAGATETLQRIHDRNEIRLGYRASSVPFSVLTEDGTAKGYSIDLCLLVANAVRVHLGQPKLPITWVPVNADTRIGNIQFGHIDVECGSTTNTISRQSYVDFSYPIYLTGARMLVRKGEDINWFKDLDGKTVAVVGETTTERTVLKAIAKRNLNTRVGYVEDHAAGFQVVADGKADAYVSDDILLYGLVGAAPNPDDFEVVGDFLSYEPYGLMIPRGDADFRQLVNATLSRFFRSGEIERLHAKWFDPINAPMSDLLRASFIVNGIPE